jgi:hypothetical protein
MTTSQYVVIAFVIAVGVVAVARLEVRCFKDLAHRSDQELSYLSRTGWTIVIALVIPVGGIVYLYYGRPH